jgi:GT2 family glycosyltransferase
MNLGVVIVSYNVRELLHGCLNSLFADITRTPGLEAQVVVVDNNSADGSAEMVAAAFPQIRLFANEENLGFAGGNNQGLRHLGFGETEPSAHRPDAVLLLNPDTEVQPGALAAMTGFLGEHPAAGGCGARLNYPDGSLQHGAFHFPGLTQLFLDLYPVHHRLLDSRLNGRYPRRLYDGVEPFAIDFALGAALMVRAEAIAAAGLLDEGYFMYAEEMDWQRRIQDAGWPLYCAPAARITHYEGQSARQFRCRMTVALWRSRLRYYDRYYPAWKRRAARWLIARGMKTKAKEARAAHARGEIDEQQLDEQLEACRQVIDFLQTNNNYARPSD